MKQPFYHICNQPAPELTGAIAITSAAGLMPLRDHEDTPILLHIHLNWDNNQLSHDYGFDVAHDLRAKIRCKAPIIFYSPIPVSYFEEKSKSELKYKLLFGRGTAFLEIPFTAEAFSAKAAEITPLNEAALHDVVTMLGDLKGVVIDKLNHDLKFSEATEPILQSIRPYLSGKQQELIGLPAFTITMAQAPDEDSFNKAKALFIEKCHLELTADGAQKPLLPAKNYKVLIIDDMAEELALATTHLQKDFEIIAKSNALDAVALLEADNSNDILAVVSDWRLFTDTRKQYWQPLQGYELLEIAAQTGMRTLFALTSQSNFLIHQLRDLMPIHFTLFQKQNLRTKGQWAVFADVLYEACAATETIITGQPSSGQWTSTKRKSVELGVSLKSIYAQQRHRRDGFFQVINERSDEAWQRHLAGKNIRYLFGEISTSVINADVLKEVLIQRRIWTALFLSGMETDSIYELLARNPTKSGNKNDATQLKIKLCIKESDIRQHKLLPEEKAWLRQNGLV